MPPTLSSDHLRALRLRAQGLTARPGSGTLAAIVRAAGGLQAQEAVAAALGARARGFDGTLESVERARVEQRSVIHTWAMRGTLHLIAAEDAGWLIALLGPTVLAGARRRHAELGIDGEVGARAVRLIRDALAARGALTRAEVAAILAPHGIPTAGQATIHLLGRAALEGVVCLGPLRGREPTYVLIDDWLGPGQPLAREAALVELTRRYLAAFGPAAPEDMAAWSGLPLREVRSGWQQVAGGLLAVSHQGHLAWLPAERAGWLEDVPAAPPVVRLLPRYDTYLLGYRGREWVVAPAYARRIHPGGGIIHAVVLVDGRASGTWRSTRRRTNLEIAVEPFEAFPPAVVAGLEDEVGSIGHFFGVPAVLRLGPPPA